MQKRQENKNSVSSRGDYAILLDLDGTIVTSTFRSKDAKAEALRFLKEKIPANGLSIDDHIRDYFQVLRSAPIDFGKRNELVKQLSMLIEKFELESVEKCELKQGAIQFINEFRGKMHIALVSNSGENAVNLSLNKFNLRTNFDCILHRDNLPDLKPSAEGIAMALQILNVNPNRAIMIGDTAMDVIASRHAGVSSVALVDGVGKLKDLEEAWPDYMMRDLKETALLVKRLWPI